MRAAIYESFGDPSVVLQAGERPIPPPSPGQVRVKMSRSPIHNHDLWTIRGTYGAKPKLPAVGGSEAAGVVEALGEGVSNVRLGDRVTGFTAGAWAEYFLSPAPGLVPLPDSISDELGCQLVAMPLSAMMLLETYGPKADVATSWLVQNAANGAVGKTLAVLAKSRGVNVVSLVRSEAAIHELDEAGVPGAISTEQPDWRARVDALLAGGKIIAGIDSIGGKASGDLCSVIGAGGSLVAFGAMSGEPMQIDGGDLIFRQIKAEGFWLSKQNAAPPNRVGPMIGELVKLVASGVLKLPVAGVFPIEEAAKAAAASARAGRNGKVLIRA